MCRMKHPIDEAGGPAEVARICKVTTPSVVQWRQRGVPIERAVEIEQGTGGRVMRWDLRPTDWHRIWPELVVHPLAPAVPSSSAAGATNQAPALIGSAS